MSKYCTGRKWHLAGLWFCLCWSLAAQSVLNFNAQVEQVSLLTCSPSDKAAYTLYGHSAVRICGTLGTDADRKELDVVFNYGIFDFSKPNFIYRFAKGETDYMLACYSYDDFLLDYQMRGSEVYEQTLNLTAREKAACWQALLLNAQPENRVYRYNFFFDNCSTRPVALFERIIEGDVVFAETSSPGSFRVMINDCTRAHPWLTFGCDLVLGLPTDRQATFRESFFLPEHVKDAFACAQIRRVDNSLQPFVSEGHTLLEAIPDDEDETTGFTPLVTSLILCFVVVSVTLFEWRRRRYFRMVDVLLFLCAGIAGCVLFFLCFASVHPGIWPNISVLWLHPFHLAGAVFFAVKKLNRPAYYYHFINFAALLLMCIGWIFVPQHVNMAFIPLIISLMIRSGYGLIRERKKQGCEK